MDSPNSAASPDPEDRERADSALRANEERQAFLLRLSDALRPLADPEQITTTAARVLCEQLGVNRAFYAVVDGNDWTLVRAHETGVVPLPGRYSIASYGQWILDLMLAGERLVVPDIAADPRYTPAQREWAKAFQVVSEAAVPLVKDGRLLAQFVVHSAARREWSEHELGLLTETAEWAWAAVERAKSESALRTSEARFRAVFETMIEACCIFDMIYDDLGKPVDWKILEANAGYEKQSGLKHVAGKLASEVMPGTEPYWFETFGRVVETGEAEQIEKWHQPTGRWIHSSTARVGASGSKRLVSVFYDITDRKRAEIALRESEERQAFLLTLSDALRPLADPAAVKVAAARVLGERLGVNRAFYAEVEGDDWLVVKGYEQGVAPLPDGPYAADTYGHWIMDTYRDGGRIVVRDTQGDPRFAAAERAAHAAGGITAAVGVPLVKGGRLVAILAVHAASPRDWTDAEIALVEETAERTWAAVERAKAEAALRRANDEAERRVRERTAELMAAMASLEAEMEKRRDLTRRLVSAQEDERRRISRDLHDSIGQLLASLSIAFKAVEESDGLPAATAAKLAEAKRVASALGKEVHSLAVRLRPPSLDDFGLETALAQLVTEWSARTGVKADFHAAGLESGRLPADVETVLYRVVQEALTNAGKHARADQVSVAVTCPDGVATAVIEDNGIGFDPITAPAGRIGLAGMRERAALVGGEVDVESTSASGTTVVARIPVRRQAERFT